MIYAALFIAVPIICFSQEKAKEPIVFKDKTGIIQAVEFPDSVLAPKFIGQNYRQKSVIL